MKVRAHVIVSGKVQGVFFRAETKRCADVHEVFGWVRNLPNGCVEAVFEGEEDSVNALLKFCRRGPPGAAVDDVKIAWEKYTGEFVDFKVK